MGTTVTKAPLELVVEETVSVPAEEITGPVRFTSETEADRMRRQLMLRRKTKLARRALLARRR